MIIVVIHTVITSVGTAYIIMTITLMLLLLLTGCGLL